jgi:hypothetical protein
VSQTQQCTKRRCSSESEITFGFPNMLLLWPTGPLCVDHNSLDTDINMHHRMPASLMDESAPQLQLSAERSSMLEISD